MDQAKCSRCQIRFKKSRIVTINSQQICINCIQKSSSMKHQQKQKRAQQHQILQKRSRQNSSTIPTNKILIQNQSICLIHNKPQEIICTTDQIKICTHCALFENTHKNHQLRTITQFNVEIQDKLSLISQYIATKKQLDNNIQIINNNLTKTIQQKKNQLQKQIQQKFILLKKSIEQIQESIYIQLQTTFVKIYLQLEQFNNNIEQVKKNYQIWEDNCIENIVRIKKCQSIDQKIQCYYAGLNQLPQIGLGLFNQIRDMQEKKDNNIGRVLNAIVVKDNINGFERINQVDKMDQESSQKTKKLCIFQKTGKQTNQKLRKSTSGYLTQRTNQYQHLQQEPDTRIIIASPLKYPKMSKVRSNQALHQQQKVPQQIQKQRVTSKGVTNQYNLMAVTDSRKPQFILQQYIFKRNTDTLDLSYCKLSDKNIFDLISQIPQHSIPKTLKLIQNHLTDKGFKNILPLIISNCINLNVSNNNLTQQSLHNILIMKHRHQIMSIKIINISHNKINQRKAKQAIQEIKKFGLIITL